MAKFDHLDCLKVAKPCPKEWAEMEGDDQTRFCEHCQKPVHNLSAMTKKEAAVLLQQHQTPCVRFEHNAKGNPVFKLTSLAAAAVAVSALGGCDMYGSTVGEPTATPEPPKKSELAPGQTVGVLVRKAGPKATIGKVVQIKK